MTSRTGLCFLYAEVAVSFRGKLVREPMDCATAPLFITVRKRGRTRRRYSGRPATLDLVRYAKAYCGAASRHSILPSVYIGHAALCHSFVAKALNPGVGPRRSHARGVDRGADLRMSRARDSSAWTSLFDAPSCLRTSARASNSGASAGLTLPAASFS